MLSVYIVGKRCTLENIESVHLIEPFVINNTENQVIKSGPAHFVLHLMTGYVDGRFLWRRA